MSQPLIVDEKYQEHIKLVRQFTATMNEDILINILDDAGYTYDWLKDNTEARSDEGEPTPEEVTEKAEVLADDLRERGISREEDAEMGDEKLRETFKD